MYRKPYAEQSSRRSQAHPLYLLTCESIVRRGMYTFLLLFLWAGVRVDGGLWTPPHNLTGMSDVKPQRP